MMEWAHSTFLSSNQCFKTGVAHESDVALLMTPSGSLARREIFVNIYLKHC